MQKIGQKVCFIVALVLVAASCMAEAAAIEDLAGEDVLDRLVKKRAGSLHFPRDVSSQYSI